MPSDVPETLEGVAIVGMAGRFPGSEDVASYWNRLARGVESIRFFDEEELIAAGNDPAVVRRRGYVPAAGYLAGADRFDPEFFGFSTREAAVTDPQHRLFLETAWVALESAGYDPATYPGAIGVIGGMSASTYLFRNLLNNPAVREEIGPGELRVRNDKDFLTSLVAYKLGLTGPCFTVQSACSTSLVAVSMACQALMTWQCDMVLAGGVSVGSPLKSGFVGHGQLFDADGHCRAFDADAAGTPAGHGVGLVLLKRLEDAVADGDRIHAVIRGFALNNDGNLKAGYAAPGVDGQAEVIAMAQAMAGVPPETIGYVEAHGTATPMGDPIEVEALTRAFRRSTDRTGFCALGSVKTNFGHLDAAAGIASLIKTVLALEHGQVPPSLNFEEPNPDIPFEETPFFVNERLIDWPEVHPHRRAGVSSFAVGGMNAHLVLEEAPVPNPPAPETPPHLLVLSARTPDALEAVTDRLLDHLRDHPDESFGDVVFTLQAGRRAFDHRRALVCADREDAIRALGRRDPKRLLRGQRSGRSRPLFMLFPGLGEQYPAMGQELYRHDPVFRREIDRCSEIASPLLGRDLRQLLYPEGADAAGETAETDIAESGGGEPDLRAMMAAYREPRKEREIDHTLFAQPAVFAVEWALARRWLELGVEPRGLLGFSLGEYVAATVAGILDLEDALGVVIERARRVSELEPGGMLAVPLSEDEVRPFRGDDLAIAAVTGPSSTVLAGPAAEIERAERELADEGLVGMRLRSAHAFHSGMMEPVRHTVVDLMGDADLQPPRIPLLSNVTGTWLEPERATDPEYWGEHLVGTVRFADDLETLWGSRDAVLVEVGPGRTLGALALQHPAREEAGSPLAVPSLRGEEGAGSERALFLESLAQVWLSGAAEVRWPEVHPAARRRLELPTYPFERRRIWIDPPERSAEPASPSAGRSSSAGTSATAAILADDRRPGAQAGEPSEASARRSRPDLPTPHVAPSSELETQVAEAWEEILGLDDLGIHDNFFALGGDSMRGPRLLLEIYRKTGIELTLRSLFQAPTIAGMADLIRDRRSGAEEDEQPTLDLAARASLDPEIVPADRSVGDPREAREVFLTGSTGFLGAFLATELLRQGVETVHCLVRAADEEEGRERLRRNLERFAVWDDTMADRLVAVPGDLEKPRLGLSGDRFESLAATVEAVYHAGAWVNATYDYEELEPANVFGTQEAIRLAARARRKPFHFVSTLGVFSSGSKVEGHSFEDSDLDDTEDLLTGYVQSKWVAEKMVREAEARGLPITIFRPPGIGGHSETGLGNLRDFGWNIIKGCIQLGAGFEGTQSLDIAPVDYVSRAIVHLSRHAVEEGGAFHLVNHAQLDWSELFRVLQDLGYDLEMLPYREWYARLIEAAKPDGDQALIPFLSLMPEPDVVERRAAEGSFDEAHHDDRRARGFLEGTDIRCPPLDARLLEIYVRSLAERDFLPEPQAVGIGALGPGG